MKRHTQIIGKTGEILFEQKDFAHQTDGAAYAAACLARGNGWIPSTVVEDEQTEYHIYYNENGKPIIESDHLRKHNESLMAELEEGLF